MPSKKNIMSGGGHAMSIITIIIVIAVIAGLIYLFVYLARYKSKPSYVKSSLEHFFSGSITDDLTPKSDEVVAALFYADWCPHCVEFKPHFEKVASTLNGTKSNSGKTIRCVAVDCVANASVADSYGVKGFPTVKIITGTGGNTNEYSGARTYDAFLSYMKSL